MEDEGTPVDAQCPSWAAALGYMGVAAAVCLSNTGSAVSFVLVVVGLKMRHTISKKQQPKKSTPGNTAAMYNDISSFFIFCFCFIQ